MMKQAMRLTRTSGLQEALPMSVYPNHEPMSVPARVATMAPPKMRATCVRAR